MNEALTQYLLLLAAEMQKDAAVLGNPWVYMTAVPFCLYAAYMWIKWYLLLAPLTIPLSLWLGRRGNLSLWSWKGNGKG